MKQHPIDHDILSLAIPSIISNITVPLLGLADLTIVGHIGDAKYISAVAIGTMVFNSIYWLTLFLRMGTSGLTAQAFGAKDRGEVVLTLQRTLFVAFLLASIILLSSPMLLPFLIQLMNAPAEAISYVHEYTNIVIWGAPAMLALYGLTGWFVGMQDTRTPMYVAIFQNVVNILASLAFVFLLDWKIEGVAAGTLVAQWAGLLLAMAALKRKLHSPFLGYTVWQMFSDYSHNWRIILSRQALRRFFVVNRDIFLRTLCMVAVNVSFTSFGGKQGATVLSVNTLLLMFFTFFSYVMDGFAFAAEALCGKYYGAHDTPQLRITIRHLLGFGIIMTLIFTFAYMTGGKEIVGLMTNDATVISASLEFLLWPCLIPVAGFAAFIYDGVFIGTTNTRAMLITTFVAASVFFAINLTAGAFGNHFAWLQQINANHFLWLAYILFLATRGVVQSRLVKGLYAEKN